VKSRLKRAVRGLVAPVGNGLARLGISADAVTWAGVIAAAAAAWGFARGDRWLALLALLASGLCDLLDGAVARAGGRKGTAFGAALDSTLDRYGEGLILGALVVRAVLRPDHAVLLPALAILAGVGSFLVSYVRARSEGLGISCEVGLLERPERLALLAILAAWGDGGLPWILGILALLTHVTFGQRLIHVRREAIRRREASAAGSGS
jgi:CDP-diacylglycerol---glycerol-3-phosphate 3-phosphatidyltransferase